MIWSARAPIAMAANAAASSMPASTASASPVHGPAALPPRRPPPRAPPGARRLAPPPRLERAEQDAGGDDAQRMKPCEQRHGNGGEAVARREVLEQRVGDAAHLDPAREPR